MTYCFETERLVVRHLQPSDVDGMAALCGDVDAMRYMDDGSTLTRDQCAGWIDICQKKYAQRGYGTSGIFHKEDNAFVGFCGVVRTPDADYDEIIYALGQPYWGQGYATEVARAMLTYVFGISELDQIYATIHPKNLASQKIMAKLGFDFVEDRREDDGSITKVYVIARPAV